MKHWSFHRVVFFVIRITIGPLLKRVMKYKCIKNKGPDAPSLIVSNHTTDLDPALLALGFTRHTYFLASEHAFRNGFPSKLMKFLFDPIPFNKARTDVQAIMDTIRRIKAGANVCIFPEGDRTFTGKTEPISASIAKLAKTCGADLITYHIEGGFFTVPRWAKKMRRGEMKGRVVNRYSAEEIRDITEKQVLELIEKDIFEDAYERQKGRLTRYRGKNLAENIETVLFMCPECKKLGTIRSEGDRFSCDCGLDGVYTETGFLEGDSLPFSTITEWGVWQKEQLAEIVLRAGSEPICFNDNQKLFEVHTTVGKRLIGEGKLQINRDSLQCAGLTFSLKCLTRIVVTGQMTLTFAVIDGSTYEVRSAVPRSALLYREIYRFLLENADEVSA